MKESIQTATNGELPEGSVFEQVFPPKNNIDDYKELSIFNDGRVLFEALAGVRRPDFLTHAQFVKLAHFPCMRSETLTKPTYTIIFKQYARKANRSLMTIDNFNYALEHIGRELLPSTYTRDKIYSTLVKRLLDYLSSAPLNAN